MVFIGLLILKYEPKILLKRHKNIGFPEFIGNFLNKKILKKR